jgi:tRNA modification GTPase
LEALEAEIGLALQDASRGRRVRDGFRIALVGAPNAGKSTLLNALVERDAAIVTSTPGTTRDIIEVPLTLGGYRTLLADTAGLRTTEDAIEAEGVRRAKAWAAKADLRLWVIDAAMFHVKQADEKAVVQPGDWVVVNKIDLVDSFRLAELREQLSNQGLTVIELAARKPGGAEQARAALTSHVVEALSGSEFPAATRIRHSDSLNEARTYLQRALSDVGLEVELAAEDVRLAARALSRITGRIDPEDVLDRVFSSFCIGK